MNIKKRSVWFLTLISLVAVITVFYVSDKPSPFDGLKLFSDETLENVDLVETSATNEKSFASENNAFEEMRMEVENKRSLLREQLTTKVGTNDFTADEKADYFAQIQELTNVDSAEGMLELIIKSIGYDDAFVRIDDTKVQIDVVASELSAQQANEIIYAVKQEWPKAYDVSVKFTGQQ